MRLFNLHIGFQFSAELVAFCEGEASTLSKRENGTVDSPDNR